MMMVAIDLDELEEGIPFSLLFSDRPWRPYRLQRSDLHRPEVPSLKEAVLETVCKKSGLQKSDFSRVMVLTQPRTLGHCFNPVSFYYLYGAKGALKAVMAEINNTPWNERFTYVVDVESQGGQSQFQKAFHVSPFMPMDQTYRWRFSSSQSDIRVSMENHDAENGRLFDAVMVMKKEELSGAHLFKCLLLFPFNTLKTLMAIYWHAAWLRIKGAKYFPHPSSLGAKHA